MKRLFLLAVIALGASVLIACTPTEQAAYDCLERETVRVITGKQETWWRAGVSPALPADAAVDATGATWRVPLDHPQAGAPKSPVYFNGGPVPNNCMVGGYITQAYPDTEDTPTPWLEWKTAAGITSKRPGLEVIGTRLHNVGDALLFSPENGSDWSVRGVQVTRAHDDCVENDGMYNGEIDDSFFDGCYTFLSGRHGWGVRPDGSANTVRITNTLVQMESMPDSESGVPGHGPIWKLGAGLHLNGISPMLAVHNTIIRVDQRPAGSAKLGIPRYSPEPDTPPNDRISYMDTEDCSDNTLVWTGPTSGPGAITQDEIDSYEETGCWTVLMGQAGIDAWNARVDAWLDAHPYEGVLYPEIEP